MNVKVVSSGLIVSEQMMVFVLNVYRKYIIETR